jgi:hypothetical protein
MQKGSTAGHEQDFVKSLSGYEGGGLPACPFHKETHLVIFSICFPNN